MARSGKQVSTQNTTNAAWNGKIPPDFDRKWGLSDAVIRASDANGRSLHVNKTMMAVHSPFFNVLFFGSFAEKLQDVVDVDIEYDVLKEILRVIHSINRNYGLTNHELYSADMLAKLYRAADQYDIPAIRELTKQQFVQIEPREAFEIAIELELHKEKSEVLKKMSFEDVQQFLSKNNDSLVLSPNDVAEMMKKCQEAENAKVRCTSCRSTNVQEVKGYNSSSQKYYNCKGCRNNFYAKRLTKNTAHNDYCSDENFY